MINNEVLFKKKRYRIGDKRIHFDHYIFTLKGSESIHKMSSKEKEIEIIDSYINDDIFSRLEEITADMGEGDYFDDYIESIRYIVRKGMEGRKWNKAIERDLRDYIEFTKIFRSLTNDFDDEEMSVLELKIWLTSKNGKGWNTDYISKSVEKHLKNY